MLKNTKIVSKLCDNLKLPLNEDTSNSTDVIVRHIYEKYFASKVSTKLEDQQQSKISQLSNFEKQHTNQTEVIAPADDDVWIFGYGSLIWKADFPYIDRRRGYICGYQRRFFQHSIDHRGTQEKPGRVVTLMATNDPKDRVYGVAYRIATTQKKPVLDHLDYREKNGYERCTVEFHEFPDTTGVKFNIIMYVATHENDSYAGRLWQPEVIAEQIFTSAGPSGTNREYLFNLAHATRELFPGVNDEHLFELEQLVRERIANDEEKMLEYVLTVALTEIIDTAKENDDETQALQVFHNLLNSCTETGWKETLLTRAMQRSKKVLNS